MFILFVNFLAYTIWLVWILKKRKWSFDIYSLAISFYVIVAFLGYFTFSTGIYQNTFGHKNANNLSIVPYFSSIMCVFLFTRPLRINTSKVLVPEIERYIPFFEKISYVMLLVFLVQALLSLSTVDFSSLDYADAYDDAAGGDGKTFSNPIIAFVYSKIIMLARLFLPIFYTVQSILIVKTRRVKNVIMILCAYLLLLVPQVLTANRGGIFFSTANLLFFVFLFWSQLSRKSKRFFVIFLAAGLFVSFTITLAISKARFDHLKNTDSTEQIFRYFGEPFPNLGFNIWDRNIKHPYGARKFPNYYSIITGESVNINSKGGRNAGFFYWERYVGIPMLNFKTIFGDLYIEYGFVGVWIFSFIWLLLLRILKKNLGLIGYIAFTFYAYQTCIWGLFGANISEAYLKVMLYMLVLLWICKKTNLLKMNAVDKKILI